jgi:Carboxypeptidase regulatory-like domain
LVSDMGRESVTTTGDFRFNPVAPGQFELFADALPDRRGNRMAGYMAISMDRERPDLRFALTSLQPTFFRVQDSGGKPVDTHDIKIQARRRDLAGADAGRAIDPARPQLLAPGRWEFSVAPMSNYYVSGFNGPGYERSEQRPPDGWNEVILGSTLGNSVTFVLTAGPGVLQGTVNGPSNKPAQGAPVFLESYDPRERRRLKDLAAARTDVRGHYQFIGLPPGTYRVFSSFDYQSPDEAAMERANPQVVTIEAGRSQAQDLDLYVLQ